MIGRPESRIDGPEDDMGGPPCFWCVIRVDVFLTFPNLTGARKYSGNIKQF